VILRNFLGLEGISGDWEGYMGIRRDIWGFGWISVD